MGQLDIQRWPMRTDSVEWQKQKPGESGLVSRFAAAFKKLDKRRGPRQAVACKVKEGSKKDFLWWERFEHAYIRRDGTSRETGEKREEKMRLLKKWRPWEVEDWSQVVREGESGDFGWPLYCLFSLPSLQSSTGCWLLPTILPWGLSCHSAVQPC